MFLPVIAWFLGSIGEGGARLGGGGEYISIYLYIDIYLYIAVYIYTADINLIIL